MKKILEGFYHGNINPNQGTFPTDPDYKKIGNDVCRLEDELLLRLNDEEKAIWESFRLALMKRSYIEDTQLFVDAFRLGAQVMLEVMSN